VVFVLINVKNVMVQKISVQFVLKEKEDIKLIKTVFVKTLFMMMESTQIVKNVIVNVKLVHLVMSAIHVMLII